MIVGSFVGYTRSFHHFICVITRILLFSLFLQHLALFPDRWRSVYKVGWWSALFLNVFFFFFSLLQTPYGSSSSATVCSAPLYLTDLISFLCTKAFSLLSVLRPLPID